MIFVVPPLPPMTLSRPGPIGQNRVCNEASLVVSPSGAELSTTQYDPGDTFVEVGNGPTVVRVEVALTRGTKVVASGGTNEDVGARTTSSWLVEDVVVPCADAVAPDCPGCPAIDEDTEVLLASWHAEGLGYISNVCSRHRLGCTRDKKRWHECLVAHPALPAPFALNWMSVPTVPSMDDLMRILDKVDADASLPRDIRDEAVLLRPLAAPDPAYVLDRLYALWERHSASLKFEPATVSLYRCVALRVVQKYMATDPWPSADERTFAAAARSQSRPGRWLHGQIAPATEIFPPHRSWLLANDDVRRLDSDELHRRLELRPDVRPPYVLFCLSPARMIATGVALRVPNALDAAAGMQPQWSPGGLAIGVEYVDRTVRIEAVEEVLWKP